MSANLARQPQHLWSPARRRTWQQYTRAARRPTHCLLLLIPLALAYEVAIWSLRDGQAESTLLAHGMLHGLLAWVGFAGWWGPPLVLLASLLTWHRWQNDRWHVRPWVLPTMLIEGLLLTIPLLVISGLFPVSRTDHAASLFTRLAQAVGAGVYEELIFRMLLISGLIALLGATLELRRTASGWIALGLAALVFAVCHFRPIGTDTFAWTSFWFRLVAGAYLGLVYWYRGIGVSGATHALFNVLIVVFSAAAKGG